MNPPVLVLSDVTLSAIQAEATRAHVMHGVNSVLRVTSNDRRFSILAEEVGEVAKELNDADIENRPVDRDKLVKELIQVAATAGTFVEALEGEISRIARRAEAPWRGSGMDRQARIDKEFMQEPDE